MSKVVRITARKDGRAGAFVSAGSNINSKSKSSKGFHGQTVRVGNKDIEVSKDGRINIPKRIMDKYGTVNADGRKQIDIQFGGRGQKIGAKITRPGYIDSEIKRMSGEAGDKIKGEVRGRLKDEVQKRLPKSLGGGGGGGGGYGGGTDDDGDDYDGDLGDFNDYDGEYDGYDDYGDIEYDGNELDPQDGGDYYFN